MASRCNSKGRPYVIFASIRCGAPHVPISALGNYANRLRVYWSRDIETINPLNGLGIATACYKRQICSQQPQTEHPCHLRCKALETVSSLRVHVLLLEQNLFS